MPSSISVGAALHHAASDCKHALRDDPTAAPPDSAEQDPPLPRLPPDILRHHLAPFLSPAALRAFRRASRMTRDAVAACVVTSVRRPPGTHALPPDLGARFPRLARLDLSGDTQLEGGLSLFRALQSATCLTCLDLSGCCALPASFVARQLPVACPRLQHLAFSCSCGAPPDTEAALTAALAAAPMAATLTSLDLHCGNAFQPEIHHLGPPNAGSSASTPATAPTGAGAGAGEPGVPSSAGLGGSLRYLRIYGSRTLDDDAVAALPQLAPALVGLTLSEQHSRRGRHIRGRGLAALGSLAGLRELSLACEQPAPREMAAALAGLTQLTSLDLAHCDPALLAALAPLRALLEPGRDPGCGGGGDGAGLGLKRLVLPTAYTAEQLERALPAMLGPGATAGAAGADPGGALQRLAGALSDAAAASSAPAGAAAASGLRSLQLHTTTALPGAVVQALSGLSGLQELSLSHWGLPGRGAAASAAAMTALTSLHLNQEYGGMLPASDEAGGGHAVGDGGGGGARPSGWYGGLGSWRDLRRLAISDPESFDDETLAAIGRLLPKLTHFSLSRNEAATGLGFASWSGAAGSGSGFCGLASLSLYDCACVSDEALGHIAALPLRTLTLAHLPAVGDAGLQQLVCGCRTLRALTLERLSGPDSAALAAVFWLPALETLVLRMCAVTNLTLEKALRDGPARTETGTVEELGSQAAVAGVAGRAAVQEASTATDARSEVVALAPSTAAGTPTEAAKAAAEKTVADAAASVAPRLTWLELQGAMISTAGLRALAGAPGLTYLDISYCNSVGDGVAEVLLLGGGSGGANGHSGSTGRMVVPATGPKQVCGFSGRGNGAGSISLQCEFRFDTGGDVGGQSDGTRGDTLPPGEGATVAVEASGDPLLLPCLVNINLHGCGVGDSAVERLRRAGFAVNTPAGLWR